MAVKEYNIGILGFGFMGKTHAYSHRTLPFFYESLPFRSRLKTVCTSKRQTAEKAAREYGFESAVTDAGAVVEDPEVDIVHICTPNHLHKEEVIAAMDAGKHIYCDKPLTADYKDAKAIGDALKSYRGIHQMTLNYRFLPAVMRAKQLMEEGFIAKSVCFRAAYLHSGSIDPEKPLEWKLDANKGGGVLNDLAVHVIDLMQHLAGSFDSIMASTQILYPERPLSRDSSIKTAVNAEDHACLMVRNDAGLAGTVEASKIATGMQDQLRFELHGTQGAMAFSLMDPNWLRIYDQTAESEPIGGKRGFTEVECVQRYPSPGGSFPASKTSIGWLRSHVACLYNFMSSLHAGRQPEPGIQTGIDLQRTIEAARISEEKGSFIRPDAV